MITLYDSNGTNYIYNSAITIQTQIDHRSSKQAGRRNRNRHSPTPSQSKQRRQGGHAMTREAISSRPAPSLIDKHGGAIDDRKSNGMGERSGRAAMTSQRQRDARRGGRRNAGRDARRSDERQASKLPEMTHEMRRQSVGWHRRAKQATPPEMMSEMMGTEPPRHRNRENGRTSNPLKRFNRKKTGDRGTGTIKQPRQIVRHGAIRTTFQDEPNRNSERAEARERHGKTGSKQTATQPAAANRQQLAHPSPGGGGLIQASRPRRAGKRGGSGEKEEREHNLISAHSHCLMR